MVGTANVRDEKMSEIKKKNLKISSSLFHSSHLLALPVVGGRASICTDITQEVLKEKLFH